jgi:hypothetical protein
VVGRPRPTGYCPFGHVRFRSSLRVAEVKACKSRPLKLIDGLDC